MGTGVRRTTLGALLALLVVAPAATASPQPAFAPGPDGAFTPFGGSAIATREACVADFNGDGNQDVAVPFVDGGAHGGIVVMDGDGTGHLGTPATVVPAGSSDLTRCAVADFNKDGRDDIAAVNDNASVLTIALGQANGTFTTTPIALPGTTKGIAIASGDLNHDGKADLLVAVKAPDELIPYVGDGTGGFTVAGTPSALTADAVSITTGDINGDQRDDGIVSFGPSGTVTAPSLADGSTQGIVTQVFTSDYTVLADLDGDGTLDVAYDDGAKVTVRHGDGVGSFPSARGSYPSVTNTDLTVLEVAVGDLNGDGRPDVAIGGSAHLSRPARAWTLTGTGNMSAPVLNTVEDGPFQVDTAQQHVRVTLADMNNDGRLDIVADTSNTGGKVAVMLNTTPVPGATTGAASPIGDTGATVAGTISASGLSTSYGVDLIDQNNSVDHRPSVGTVNGTGADPVTIPVTGLTPDTTYRYRVYGTNANGTTVGRIRTFHTKIARPVNQSPPTLSGNPLPGNDLTCGDGTWSGSPTLAISWLRGGVVIGGQAAHTYTVQAGDVGSAVGCRVTAANAGGSVSADSPTFVVAAVPPGAPQNASPPTVSGQAKVGSPLACNAGSWTAGGTFTYAWLRDGVAIPGATGPGFVVRKSDAGHALACGVTLTNSFGSATANSAGVNIPLPDCVVPNLRGVTLKAARSRLKAANCRPGKIVKKTGTGVAVGHVLGTSPKAGVHKRNGTKVKLFVRK